MKTKHKMKTKVFRPIRRSALTSVLFSIYLIFSQPIMANNSSNNIIVKASGQDSILLYLPEGMQNSFKVVLKDSNGLILHKETLDKGIEQRLYNLKNLPLGDYLIAVSYHKTTQWLNIRKKEGYMEVDQANVQTIIQPRLLLHNEFLDLNMLCFLDSKLSFRISDLEGHLLSEEIIKANGSLQQRYNLSGLKNGSYRITVSIEKAGIDWTYVQTIEWSQKNKSKPNSSYAVK